MIWIQVWREATGRWSRVSPAAKRPAKRVTIVHVAAEVNVKIKGLQHVVHHVRSASGPPDHHRRQAVGFDQDAQGLTFTEQMPLTHDVSPSQLLCQPK